MAYPAYGGAWERTIRDSGRVGSLFDPGGARASNLVNRDLPPQPDELERMRQSEQDDGSADQMDDNDLDLFRGKGDTEDSNDDDSAELDMEADLSTGDDDLDQELERRRRELDDMELQDIHVIPGEPLPPIF